MSLGTLLIIAVILGIAFFIRSEANTYKDVKKQNPGASRAQVFSRYMDVTNAEGDRRRAERREEANRRNERYLEQAKTRMALSGNTVFAEDDEKIYFLGADGHTYNFDKKGHYTMEQY